MHPVERKLKCEILPYLVSARRAKSWPPLWVYAFYAYVGEVFVLLAGFGIANPVMNFLAGGTQRDANATTVVAFLSSTPAAVLSILLLVAWGILKFYVRTEELEKRCNLLKSCMRQCKAMEIQVRQAVARPNPMPELIRIQEKLSDLVERNMIENAWPFESAFAAGIESEVEKTCSDLIDPYKNGWEIADADERKTQ